MCKRENLLEASKHLWYEAEMLRRTVWVYQVTDWRDDEYGYNAVVRNAIIESFTIHARVLLAFLYFKPQKSTDVVATDFFSDPKTWVSLLIEEEIKKARETSNLVSRYCAHLTEFRQQEIKWDFQNILRELSEKLIVFLKNAPHEAIDPRWLDWKKEYENVDVTNVWGVTGHFDNQRHTS